jgi:cytochrome subunit of sulfide dehydrogenase
MKKWLIGVLLTSAFGLATAQASKETLQARGLAAACFNCHGTDGRAQPGMEPLAGMNKDDLAKKMLDFKAGRKPATIMHQLSKGYTDEQIQAIAGFFAAQTK